MRKISLFVLTIIILVGCSKSSSDATATVDFLPLTTGSNWTYQSISTGTTTTTSVFTLTITGKDTTVTGSTVPYKVLSNTAGANNYWGKVSHDYYRYGAFAGTSSSTGLTLGNIEEHYLVDNLAVNGTWSGTIPFTYSGISLNLTAAYKIAATGGTKTVTVGTYSNSFTDVTQVHLDLSMPSIFGGTIAVGAGDFYYARGIGLVSFSLSISANTTYGITASSVQWNIQAYQIK